MKKIWISAGIVLLAAIILCWREWFSPTKVGFLNYQTITLGQISSSNDNPWIRIRVIDPEDISQAGKCDMVFVNAMGLKITGQQRETLLRYARKGLPVLSTAITNPENSIVSVDSAACSELKAYLTSGGKGNYRNMLRFVRDRIDRKIFRSPAAEAPVTGYLGQFYHPDPDDPDNGYLEFGSLAEYTGFLREHGLAGKDAPSIVITGQMGEPAELISCLERSGNTVYPVRDMKMFIQSGQADSTGADAVINMAHGRMGDYVVRFLEERDIPLFAPLNVNRPADEWAKDRMGMSGGFMSQSIVTPEIDGALRPYALFGHYMGDDGLEYVKPIPGRLETFVSTVNRYISLKRKPESQKKVAIYYYKGPGQNALTATGLEVVPSLYNLLCAMRDAGYDTEGLPDTEAGLARILQRQGAVLGSYAQGAIQDFIEEGSPELISEEMFGSWCGKSIARESYEEAVRVNGPFPGNYLTTDDGRIAVPRVQFGNVVLLPQLAAGLGDDTFRIVHGTDKAPTYPYIASYLWTRYGFGADIIMHFGTHGSLEFTPGKQVALGEGDWPDMLIGDMPHIYLYSIGDVGEAMTAKRRSYAGILSHLTPAFTESGIRGQYKELEEAIGRYYKAQAAGDSAQSSELSEKVKKLTVGMGIHRDLRLDSLRSGGYTGDEIARIDRFAEELSNEKITGENYTLGKAYRPERIESSIYAMCTDPIAYALQSLDRLRSEEGNGTPAKPGMFTEKYARPAKELIGMLLRNPSAADDALVCKVAGISMEELGKAREIAASTQAPQDMMEIMQSMAQSSPVSEHAVDAGNVAGMDIRKVKRALEMARKMGASPEALAKMEAKMTGKPLESIKENSTKPDTPGETERTDGYTKDEISSAMAVIQVENTILNIERYRRELLESPSEEIRSILDAMDGGYTSPSPGGDPIVNPNTLPTGRNLYAVNAEATPSERAWEEGVELARSTIRMYRESHHDSLPRKISYTLWSGEFIETEGATIAQILYMLGVEPVRDMFGRVSDLRLIPSSELGRPRIDVVVQTSGQLRDIAASRLFLISRAVDMAAGAGDDIYENMVARSVTEAEKILVGKGMSPKEAREVSRYRVFGGVDGNYGTGITGAVQNSDSWESTDELAQAYIMNMGAYYGSEKDWEKVSGYALEAALAGTDAIVQPRQSNTWGALSLDHVYEFMGGMSMAVRKVTGKEPEAYFSDYRNHSNMRMQDLREAIGVESRTTIFNPGYIREKMKGGAGTAASFAEIIQNTYGWNVTRPSAVDDRMWDEIYEVYVKDSFGLGTVRYFEETNPAALEEITAVMLETARKGMWKASGSQLNDIAELHADLIEKYGPSCSGTVCDNASLRDYIESRLDSRKASQYGESIQRVREKAVVNQDKGMVLKKEEMESASPEDTTSVNGTAVAVATLLAMAAAVVLIRFRRRNSED